MEQLPYIDEHDRALGATPEQAWAATVAVVGATLRGGSRLAWLLGCEPGRASGRFDGGVGQELPGFRVEAAEPGRRLALAGRHRFAAYRLTFLIEEGRMRAVTHAAFPGLRGKAYRALVIGSGGHRLATRDLLRRIARRAERG